MNHISAQKFKEEIVNCDILSANNILPSNRVNCFSEDPLGRVWIGTESGLVRYDGIKAELINESTYKELTGFLAVSDMITLSPQRERILIILANGFAIYDNISGQFLPLKVYLPADFSKSEVFLKGGLNHSNRFWLFCNNTLLLLEVKETSSGFAEIKTLQHILINDKVRYISESSEHQDSYMVFTESTLYHLKLTKTNHKLEKIITFPASFGSVNTVTEISKSVYLVGSEKMLFRVDMQSGRRFELIDFPELKHIRNLYFDLTERKVFILTRGSLIESDLDLTAFRTLKFQFSNNETIVKDDFYNFYKDKSGYFWISTLQSGAIRYNTLKPDFGRLNKAFRNNGFSEKTPVWSIFEDSDKSLLIGSNGELFRYYPDNNKVEKLLDFNSREFASVNQIRSILADTFQSRRIYWLAVFNYGLVKFDPGTNEVNSYNRPDRENYFYQIVFDHKGNILAGNTDSGLLIFDKTTTQFHEFKYFSDLPERKWVTNIFSLNHDKDFVLSTYLNGLLLYSSETRKITVPIKIKTSKSENSMYKFTSVIKAGDDNFLVGTLSRGILLTDDNLEIIKNYTYKDGLPNDNIFGLIKDESGYVWIGSGKGISRFDTQSDNFLNYSASDGFVSNDMNLNSLCKTSNGNLLFGTNFGIVFIDPKLTKKAFETPPFTIILSVRKGQQEYSKNRSVLLELPNDDQPLQIKFSGIHPQSGNRIKYRYKIKYVSEDWINIGSQTELNFISLPAGEYNLVIQAANAAGLWDQKGAILKFKIEKNIWAQTWFILIAFLCLAGIIYLITILRVRALIRIEQRLYSERYKIRTKLNEDLHDELGHKLTSIKILTDSLSDPNALNDDIIRKKIEKLNIHVSDFIREIKEFTWVMNPGKDTIDDLVNYIWKLLDGLLDGTEISFNIVTDDADKATLSLDVNEKNTIVKVVKESVINAVKHAKGLSGINVVIATHLQTAVVKISDNGCGFNQEIVQYGSGVIMNKSRAAQCGGTLEVKSAPGDGTEVVLTIPNLQNGKLTNQQSYFTKLFQVRIKNDRLE